ncbi:MAG TPA: DUF4382 domain-containing protein [Capsulimonadaceae bacterium]
MILRRTLGALCAIAAVFAVAGCGGGGGTSSPTSGGTPGTPLAKSVGVYVTDTFKDDFAQVWITVYKIELSTDGTTYTPVFDSTDGVSVDAASLASKAQLLGTVDIPSGDYKFVRLTTGDHFSIVPKAGGASVSVAVSTSKATVSGGKAVITVGIPKRIEATGANNIVIDFNLAAFKLVGSSIEPAVGDGDDASFPGKVHEAEIRGTVSNLVAGTSFDLILPAGGTVPVKITASTVLISPVLATTSSTAPVLANDQKVVVIGKVDTTTHLITADRIRIIPAASTGTGGTGGTGGTPPPPPSDFGGSDDGNPGAPPPPPSTIGTVITGYVIGTVTAVNPTAKTITVTIQQVEGFQPGKTTFVVQTSGLTRFSQEKTVISLASIAVGSRIIASGSVDPSSGALNAAEVHLLLK